MLYNTYKFVFEIWNNKIMILFECLFDDGESFVLAKSCAITTANCCLQSGQQMAK